MNKTRAAARARTEARSAAELATKAAARVAIIVETAWSPTTWKRAAAAAVNAKIAVEYMIVAVDAANLAVSKTEDAAALLPRYLNGVHYE